MKFKSFDEFLDIVIFFKFKLHIKDHTQCKHLFKMTFSNKATQNSRLNTIHLSQCLRLNVTNRKFNLVSLCFFNYWVGAPSHKLVGWRKLNLLHLKPAASMRNISPCNHDLTNGELLFPTSTCWCRMELAFIIYVGIYFYANTFLNVEIFILWDFFYSCFISVWLVWF